MSAPQESAIDVPEERAAENGVAAGAEILNTETGRTPSNI